MPKFPLLFQGGLELVLECLTHRLWLHRRLFCLIGAKAVRAKAAQQARLTVWAYAQPACGRLFSLTLRTG